MWFEFRSINKPLRSPEMSSIRTPGNADEQHVTSRGSCDMAALGPLAAFHLPMETIYAAA